MGSEGVRKFLERVRQCIRKALPAAYKTSIWLLKIMLPVSLFVTLLSYFEILPYLSSLATPLFTLVGLPGEAALVFITSIFTNIYTVIALLANMDFSVREGLIISTMCLISHGFIIETLVLKKTGSSAVGMVLLRLVGSFVAAIALNRILPEMNDKMITETITALTFWSVMKQWLFNSLLLCLQILLIVSLLMILQRLLEEFGILRILSRFFSPLMTVFGLPSSVSFLWIVGNTVGLAYGSAIMMEYAREGKLSERDADLLNHHLAISHSQLEDPLLFTVLGLPLLWLIVPRVMLAVLVVWLKRGENKLRDMMKPACRTNDERHDYIKGSIQS